MSGLMLLPFLAAVFAQAQTLPVTSITVEGNRILASPAIVQVTGLKPGTPGDSAAFDAARDKLLASGYFDSVAYRYKPVGSGYNITFEVKETSLMFPVHVEALPVSTDQLAAALRAYDPLFMGKMPGNKASLDRAIRLLEGLAPGVQAAAKIAPVGADGFEIQFTPRRGLPAVASVAFEGSKVITAAELRNKIADTAFGQIYSESGFREFLDAHVRPLYEAKGYMNVMFPKIATVPSSRVDGLDVTVSVAEGGEYKLSGIRITGTDSGENTRLLRVAKIPAMTTANFDQIRDGAARLRDALQHDGFLEARTLYDHKRDDGAMTVEAILNVMEGPRYLFGKLTVNGLGLDGEAAIRKMWAVRPGDPFPQDYASYFASQVKQEGLFDNLADVKGTAEINRVTHTVDATVEFKSLPAGPKAPRRPGFRR